MVQIVSNAVSTSKNNSSSRPTRIAVDLADGRARVSTLEQGYFLGGRIMQITGPHVRLAIVGIHLPLLGGDNVVIQVRVGPGVILEVIEPSGMVAYDADGELSRWSLNATVETEAALIWHGREFIAAKGSNAHRYTEIELAQNAQALLRETLVLGRSGEPKAQLNSKTDVYFNDSELLMEELILTPETRRLPGISGPSKVISTISALGLRPGSEVSSPQRLDLAGPGALWRSMAAAAHLAEKEMGPVFRAWRNEIMKSLRPE